MNIQEDEVYNKTLDMLESIFSTPFDFKLMDCGFNSEDGAIKVTRLYENGQLVILYASYEEGSLYPFHKHEESAEHFVCIRGKFQVNIKETGESNELIRYLTPSECMTMPIGVEHSVYAVEKSEVVVICIPPELAYCGGK